MTHCTFIYINHCLSQIYTERCAFTPGTLEAGNVLWYVSRAGILFIQGLHECSADGKDSNESKLPQESLSGQANHSWKCCCLKQAIFVVRGHCSFLGLHPDKRGSYLLKIRSQYTAMRHMTCEWLDWVMSLQNHQKQQQNNTCLSLLY